MFVSCRYSETQLSVCVYIFLNFTINALSDEERRALRQLSEDQENNT